MLKWTIDTQSGERTKPTSRVKRAAALFAKRVTKQEHRNSVGGATDTPVTVKQAQIKRTKKLNLKKLAPSQTNDNDKENIPRVAKVHVQTPAKKPNRPIKPPRRNLPHIASESALQAPPSNIKRYPSHYSFSGLLPRDYNCETPVTLLLKQYGDLPGYRKCVYKCATPGFTMEGNLLPPPLPPKKRNSVILFVSPMSYTTKAPSASQAPPSLYADSSKVTDLTTLTIRNHSTVIHDNTDPRFLDLSLKPNLLKSKLSIDETINEHLNLTRIVTSPNRTVSRSDFLSSITNLRLTPDQNKNVTSEITSKETLQQCIEGADDWSMEAVLSDTVHSVNCSLNCSAEPDYVFSNQSLMTFDNNVEIVNNCEHDDTWNSHCGRKLGEDETPPSSCKKLGSTATPPRSSRKLGSTATPPRSSRKLGSTATPPRTCRIWRENSKLPRYHSTPRKTPKERIPKVPKTLTRQSRVVRSLKFNVEKNQWKPRMTPRVIVRRYKFTHTYKTKGLLRLSVYHNHGLITIHVLAANKLRCASGGLNCYSYVKIALIPNTDDRAHCRTPLHPDSVSPKFDQKFSFEFLPQDSDKRFLVSVWHRNRSKRKSELMGCMSFGVKNALKKDICGWFRLLSERYGRRQHMTSISTQMKRGCADSSSRDSPIRRDPPLLFDLSYLSNTAEHDPCGSSLRLDTKCLDVDSSVPLLGRTPYTLTLEMCRGEDGFGFSVAWTQPPRVERVEASSPAATSGMRPGDYIIFVGEENVVKMEEEKVLELIQSRDHLVLEIYRRGQGKPLEGLNGTLLDSFASDTVDDSSFVRHFQTPPRPRSQVTFLTQIGQGTVV